MANSVLVAAGIMVASVLGTRYWPWEGEVLLPVVWYVQEASWTTALYRSPRREQEANAYVFDVLREELGYLGALAQVRASKDAARARVAALLSDRASGGQQPKDRAGALGTLGYVQVAPPSTQRIVEEALADPSPLVRQVALTVLLSQGGERRSLVPRVLELAQEDPSREVRGAAVHVLGYLAKGSHEASVALAGIAGEKDAPLALYAEAALVRMGSSSDGGIARLAEALEGAGDPQIRELSAKLLGSLGSLAAPAVPSLLSALDDQEKAVRAAALAGLAAIGQGGQTVLSKLREIAVSDDPRNLSAYNAMLELKGGESAATAAMLGLLRRDDTGSKVFALLRLVDLDDQSPEFQEALLHALRGDIDVPSFPPTSVLKTVAGMAHPPPAALEYAFRFAGDEDPWVRRAAAAVLSRYDEPAERIAPVLLRLLEDPHRDVRETAAEALPKYEAFAAEVGAGLARMALDADEWCWVRRTAIQAIGALGTQAPAEARRALEELQETYVGSRFEEEDFERGYWDTPELISQSLLKIGDGS